MDTKVRKTRSFKENLKRMLFVYALVPVFLLIVICAAVFLTVGSCFIADNNKKVNSQIAQSLEKTLDEYELLVKEISETPNVIDPLMSSTKRQIIARKLYAVSIETGYEGELYILNDNGELCESINGGDYSEKFAHKATELARSAKALPAIHAVTLGGSKKIYLAQPVSDDNTIKGYIVVALPQQEFDNLISADIQTNMIADSSNWIFAADSRRFMDAVGRVEASLGEKQGFCSLNGQYCYVTVKDIKNNFLKVYTITDNTEVVNIMATAILTSLGVLLFVVIISLSSAERMANKTTADVVKINDAFAEVSSGSLNSQLDIHSSEEFESISKGYNDMLNSLKQQIAANRELAETVAEAQVRQLKSQFNSHFLFNTLDNIRFMCKIDPNLAENMTVMLSELLRYNTSRSNEKVSVEEDLKYINIYLQIMKVRFRERFDFSVDISEAVKINRIPKLLMQPLIENSIKYGFGDRENLAVRVKVFKREQSLVLVCNDNGVGITAEKLQRIRQNLSLPENKTPQLGLYNVHRRIVLIYGEKYGMKLESENGVSVTLTLPLEEEGEEVLL